MKELLNNPEWLKEQNKTKTIKQISSELEIKPNKLSYYYKKFNIKIKLHRTVSFDNYKNEIISLYKTRKYSITLLADKFSLSEGQIKYGFTKNNIKTIENQPKIILDPNLLKYLHLDLKYSINKISEILKAESITVKRNLEYWNIQYKLKSSDEKLKDKDWLKEQLEVNKKSLSQLIKEYGFSRTTLNSYINKYGIKRPKNNFNNEVNLLLENKEWLYDQHHNLNKPLSIIANELEISRPRLSEIFQYLNIPIKKCHNISIFESEISKFLTDDSIHHELNNRTIINKELDIYIPEYNFAIEFNGIYWHNELNKHKNYHYDKWNKCQEKDIDLLQIWEDDWINNKELIKKHILYRLKKESVKVFARKCKFIINPDINDFLDKYHIQGKCKSTLKYGLEFNDELVAVISFIKRDDFTIELNRFATKYQITGGFSKLLKNSLLFLKDYKEIITFADLCVSNGDLYYKTGFQNCGLIVPDYKYVYKNKRYHKFNFRKNKIKSNPELEYIEGYTEKELMKHNKIYRIYDAGKFKFKYKIKGNRNE